MSFNRRPCRVAKLLVAALAALLLIVGACETPFDVFEPSDERHYAVYGVLDAAMETQVIRVESLSDSVAAGAPPNLDAVVRLEEVGTGRIVEMEGSYELLGEGTRVHNFRTDATIQPGATYRLTVERSDGATTEVTTTVPNAFPKPVVTSNLVLPCPPFPTEARFRINAPGIAQPAAALVQYFRDGVWFDHIEDAFPYDGGTRFEIEYAEDLRLYDPEPRAPIECGTPDNPIRVVIGAGGPDWPEFTLGVPGEEVLTEEFSNVENGTGFVGGVITDTVDVYWAGRPDGSE